MDGVAPAPLEGLKVIEFGVAMAGPFCGKILADYGADVLKIERIGSGDESRNWPPFFADILSHYFAAANPNKRSIAVDLKCPEGVELVHRLALEADVIIDNFRYGALDRLGLGYDSLKDDNPRLVYCSISGFGAGGPRRDERANDLTMQAFAGGMSLTGEPEGGPARMGISVADIGAGMFGAIGILMALGVRDRTGQGQRVDTSLFEGQMAMLANHYASYFCTGSPPLRRGSAGPGMVPYQAFRAEDDWMIVASFTERMWRGVCRAVEREELAEDPRYVDARARFDNREELVALLAGIFSARPLAYWEQRLGNEGVPFTRVNTLDRVVEDEQVNARRMIANLEHAEAGPMRLVGLPVKFSATPGRMRSAPPVLGQHTAEVLRELGFDEATIADYARERVVQDAALPAAEKTREGDGAALE